MKQLDGAYIFGWNIPLTLWLNMVAPKRQSISKRTRKNNWSVII